MPGLPLPLRNALAELAIAAHDDEVAVAALAWLADRAAATPPPAAAARLGAVHLIDRDATALLPVHAPHADAVTSHAARALRAVHAGGASGDPGTGRACRIAAALWNERLFFEVHEVLEAIWKPATGAERQALQGVIQIAVALHHLAHGNRRGARSLLTEGRGRLATVPATTLPVLDVERLLAATAGLETALARGEAPQEAPPRLELAQV